MSNRLPLEINPYRLIEQKRLLSGDLALQTLPRLQELTHSHEGSVAVDLSFEVGDTGLPMIHGQLTAVIPLSCQRCMESYEHPFNARLEVVLTRTDAEAAQIQDNYDTWLVEDDRIFLQDFIEDEILLAIPIIVKHDNCELDDAAKRASFSEEMLKKAMVNMTIANKGQKNSKQEKEKENPFALLKNWKNTE